jgi:protoporphyrinogen oxidase
MPDVTIVGGGLSGLVAAYTLEQHEIDYSLIEVKRQPGGSLRSTEQNGFTIDSGAFALRDRFDRDWLASLGLDDALIPLDSTPGSAAGVAFAGGTQSLIDALSAQITAPRMMRMAVSSIGELGNGRFALCMENGLILDAAALILAVPARYAERMFYAYLPDVAALLLDYDYDTIQRVSLGYTERTGSALPRLPDMAHVFQHRTQHPSRVPAGGELLHFGMRIDPQRLESPAQLVDFLQQRLNLPEPVVAHVGYWPEADPISCYDDAHPRRMARLQKALPSRLALIGSDYALHPPLSHGLTDLASRIEQGQQAARQIMQAL